jgi:hypothetical protein
MSRSRPAHSHLILLQPQECGGSLGTRKAAESPVQKSAKTLAQGLFLVLVIGSGLSQKSF